ncbi:MAG: carboxypeptidase regulatory-like domain-containing protein, partial [Fidelibacterota bacterium]
MKIFRDGKHPGWIWTHLVTLLLLSGGVQGAHETLRGRVRDQATHQPLVGANVIIEGTDRGAATDENGRFVVPQVPPGIYHVRIDMIGYRPLVKLNVRVVPQRGAVVFADLVQQPVELREITVTRAYFEKEKDAFVSSRTVDFEEIRRDPSGFDIQRMMQALPSVVSTADQQNEIIVRGGAPGENLFLMDNIEIANPNHFGEQGTGGGPVNMVNTLFVDRVDFLAGAFPAKYGDKASSVMDIRLGEGNRQIHGVDLDMSMAGLGFFAEGPLVEGRGSYMASFRKSYLDLIIRQTGLTAVPRYWNAQAKTVFDIGSRGKLLVNLMHGNDAIDIEGENTPQTRGAENVNVLGSQSVVGLTYKQLWRRQGMSRFTVAGTRAQFIYDVYRFTEKGRKLTYYEQDETEWDLQAKGDFLWRLSPDLELSGGLDLKYLGADFYSDLDPDTVWVYAYALPGQNPPSFEIIDRGTWEAVVRPVIENADPDSVYLDPTGTWHYGRRDEEGQWEFVRVRRQSIERIYEGFTRETDDAFLRTGAFFQVKWRPFLRLMVNLGLRAGAYEYTGFRWLSPRLALSTQMTDRSTLNLAFGRHFQTPPLSILTMNPGNGDLRSKYADQMVFGIEHFLSEDTRGTVEVYGKRYHDIPISVSETTLDTADRSTLFVNEGEGYSYGTEFFLQKKLARDVFGTFSYSHYVAMARDVRYPEEKRYFPWTFDFRDVLTFIGGYKLRLRGPGAKRTEDQSILDRILARTIGGRAQELELSFRYRYVGGKPYTPRDFNPTVRMWFEPRGTPYNTRRFPAYHRLDLMVLWHYTFRNMSLVAYFDLQNVFDRDNVWDIQRNPDGTRDYVYQFKVFPIGGFT